MAQLKVLRAGWIPDPQSGILQSVRRFTSKLNMRIIFSSLFVVSESLGFLKRLIVDA